MSEQQGTFARMTAEDVVHTGPNAPGGSPVTGSGQGSSAAWTASLPATRDPEPGYPPFDVLKPIAPNVWIVDGAPIRAGGLPLPVRMTVIRLPDGSLLLHAPTPFRRNLREPLADLGPVRHLVAPGFGHWMYLEAWQRTYPEATTWGVSGLRDRALVRAAKVRIDADLWADPPLAWGGAIALEPINGPGFAEVELFHRPSRTLILTDLVLNLEPPGFSLLNRVAAQVLGVCAPHGRAPLYLRTLLSLNRNRIATATARLVATAPERVVFAHGRWFDDDAPAQLAASLAWALPGPSDGLAHNGVRPASDGNGRGLGGRRRLSAGPVSQDVAVLGVLSVALGAYVVAQRRGRRRAAAPTMEQRQR